MKFTIGDNPTVYDANRAVERISLQNLYVLKLRDGIGVRTLVQAAEKFKDVKDPVEILDDLEALNTFRVMVWLARTAAGDVGADGKAMTVDEANDFPVYGMRMVWDDEEEEAAARAAGMPDPKAPASRPAGGTKRQPRPSTSKTSKKA